MAEYTEEDVHRARTIVDELLEWGDGPETGFRASEKLEEGLSLVDIQADAEEFKTVSDLLNFLGLEFPAIKVAFGPPVPVSLSLASPRSLYGSVRVPFLGAG